MDIVRSLAQQTIQEKIQIISEEVQRLLDEKSSQLDGLPPAVVHEPK